MDQSWTTNWIVLFPVHGALAIVVWERNGNPLRVLRARIALWTSPGWSLFRTQNQYDCDTNGHRMFMCESMIFWMFLCGCTAAAIRNKQRTKTEAGNLTDWSSRSSAPERSQWMNESSTRTAQGYKQKLLNRRRATSLKSWQSGTKRTTYPRKFLPAMRKNHLNILCHVLFHPETAGSRWNVKEYLFAMAAEPWFVFLVNAITANTREFSAILLART